MINQKIGVLGGGQLGKMLCQAASELGIRLHILEKDDSFPAAGVCPDMTYGDFKNYDDVMAFGKDKDILTVEIEAVNTEALKELEQSGVKVFPQPHLLDLIKDKGLQKQFYADHNLPTSDFELFEDAASVRAAVQDKRWNFPFVQKSRKDGYDGQGVKVVKSESDLEELLDVPCLLEKMVDIDQEIAVIVARNEVGEIQSFPVVGMEFHPTANLVEYLFSPSNVSDEVKEKAITLAERLTTELGIVGLLAVELFLDKDGNILINEVAPRPHNSGHHTIEANITSQYEQHIRAIAGLPLGKTDIILPAVMVNLLGDPDYKGKAYYDGIDKCLPLAGAHFHIYGKADTKPYRKMGHVTVVDEDLENAVKKANFIKEHFKIISK